MEFLTHNGSKISGEATPTVIFIKDWMREGKLGLVTIFCHHNQVKLEASEVLSALCQHDSLEPSMVVVWFTKSPYTPWGPFSFPYLDVTTLCRGATSTQFPLYRLCPWKLLPHSSAEVVLPQEEGEEGWNIIIIAYGDFSFCLTWCKLGFSLKQNQMCA